MIWYSKKDGELSFETWRNDLNPFIEDLRFDFPVTGNHWRPKPDKSLVVSYLHTVAHPHTVVVLPKKNWAKFLTSIAILPWYCLVRSRSTYFEEVCRTVWTPSERCRSCNQVLARLSASVYVPSVLLWNTLHSHFGRLRTRRDHTGK